MPRQASEPRLGQRKGGPVWYILWHDGQRDRRRSTNTEDHGEAEKALAEFNLTRDAPERIRSPAEFPIDDALALYLAAIEDKPGAETAVYNVRALRAFWGTAKVDAVTEQSVAAYMRHRRAMPGSRRHSTISDDTIARELAVLRRAINLAFQQGQLTRAPFVAAPPAAPGRDLWLEDWEAHLLVESCVERHIRLYVLILLYTLARPAAALELKWRGQIDFQYRRVYLNPPDRVQTRKRRPPVPMADELYEELLAAHKAASTPNVIEYRRVKKDEEVRAEVVASVRTGFEGAVVRARRTVLERARALPIGNPKRAALLETARKFRRTIAYTIRHTGATWMAQAGVDLHKIAAWMGHSYTRTTELYAHHHPDYLGEGAEAISLRMRRGRERGVDG